MNFYGITKRDAEIAVLGVEGAHVAVLRVPILSVSLGHPPLSYDHHRAHARMHRRYGPTPSNAESAVNILLDVVQDQSGKKYTMDHYQTRFPTNVVDVAGFLVRLASMDHLSLDIPGAHFFLIREPEKPRCARLPPVIHYSAEEPFTKYEICLVFARILGVPHAHIIPDVGPPPPGTAPHIAPYIVIHDDLMMRVHILIQGRRHARTTRSYICARRKTWVSKVGLGRAGLRNGGEITSARTRRSHQRLTGVGGWEAWQGESVGGVMLQIQ